MKSRIAIIFILCIFTIPTIIFAQQTIKQSTHQLQLNELTENILQLTRQERYLEANNLLEIFSDEFTTAVIHQRTVPMDQVRTITMVHQDALVAVNNVELSHDEKVKSMIRLRLVVDAMTSNHQPLWVEMQQPIISTFQHLKDSIELKDSDLYRDSLSKLRDSLHLIQPSLIIDAKYENVMTVDAHIQFLDENRDELFRSYNSTYLESVEQDFRKLFENLKEDDTDPNLIWVMLSTGSFIIVTLAYVAIRKYAADRKKSPERKKLKD
ncbi:MULTISPECIES: sporulation protein YpjB [Bacillus]|uniref:sporulation protein YpjB n=1 Tax=Bacillus TaxID=1386 RepID=UPI000BB8D65C|nr:MULTISPECIES: sporulation protein YpjB [Bacillus]